VEDSLMKVSVKEKGVFQSLLSRDIRAYLEAQGWKPTDRIGDKAIILSKDEIPYELLLPLRKELGDYALRVAELISTIAQIEDRSEISIVEDIGKSGLDIIRIRLTERAEDGTIPFSVTTEALQNALPFFRNPLSSDNCN
jgi:hypothetical protein